MPATVEAYGRRIHTASPDVEGTSFYEFRFTCNDIAFEDVIPAWLTLREDAATACNVFFGMQYARPGYTETRLLLSAIAAEGFHAAFSDTTTHMADEDFEVLRAKVLDAVEDEDERAWVDSALANRMSFRRRLRALTRIPDRAARSLVVPDVETWVDDVVAARNTLAHTGKPHIGHESVHAGADDDWSADSRPDGEVGPPWGASTARCSRARRARLTRRCRRRVLRLVHE